MSDAIAAIMIIFITAPIHSDTVETHAKNSLACAPRIHTHACDTLYVLRINRELSICVFTLFWCEYEQLTCQWVKNTLIKCTYIFNSCWYYLWTKMCYTSTYRVMVHRSVQIRRLNTFQLLWICVLVLCVCVMNVIDRLEINFFQKLNFGWLRWSLYLNLSCIVSSGYFRLERCRPIP